MAPMYHLCPTIARYSHHYSLYKLYPRFSKDHSPTKPVATTEQKLLPFGQSNSPVSQHMLQLQKLYPLRDHSSIQLVLSTRKPSTQNRKPPTASPPQSKEPPPPNVLSVPSNEMENDEEGEVRKHLKPTPKPLGITSLWGARRYQASFKRLDQRSIDTDSGFRVGQSCKSFPTQYNNYKNNDFKQSQYS